MSWPYRDCGAPMSWRWVATPATDRVLVPDRTFPTQGEAETWLGEFFPELVAAGARTVSLYEADRLVYGPMSLDADAS